MGILDVLLKQKTQRVGIKLALLDVSLDDFAKMRTALSVWSRIADDAVWVVSEAKQAHYLVNSGISPHKVYTAKMMAYLLSHPGFEQPISPKIQHALKLLDAEIIKVWEW